MKLDVLTDATGTALTYRHPLAYAVNGVPFWWDHDATHGWASHTHDPQTAAVHDIGDPFHGVAVRGAIQYTVWVSRRPDLALDHFIDDSATAHEFVLDPSVVADFVLLSRQQQTSYRLAFTDTLKVLREALARPVAKQQRSAEAPFIRPGTTDEVIWVAQLSELKQLAALTNEQLASVFGVSRTSVQDWLSGGGMRSGKREHLRQILEIARDASARLGSSQQLHELLLTPQGAHGRRAIDYLAEKQYALARGYLQPRVDIERKQGRRPIRSRVPQSPVERLERLEELSPPPRDAWNDE